MMRKSVVGVRKKRPSNHSLGLGRRIFYTRGGECFAVFIKGIQERIFWRIMTVRGPSLLQEAVLQPPH